MTDAQDAALIDRIARQERLAFEAFFGAHGAAVERFVRGVVHDEGLAEELTSDVMVEVWRGAGRFRGGSRVRTWLFGIAHHKAIDAVRRRRLATTALEDALEVPARTDGPETLAVGALERERIERAIASLSPEHRAVLELTYLAGFSQREIAEIVACPVATVKTRAFYAKQRLRDLLGATEMPR